MNSLTTNHAFFSPHLLLSAISLALLGGITNAAAAESASQAKWTACGWGGGGYYYSAVYHPTQKGVIYMGSDVAGAYKTEDNGKNWRLINNGLRNFGVFSLAVDRTNPQVVYAATEGGLCKSVDAGEHWAYMADTDAKNLHITGEKNKSVHCIAVDPSNGNNVYAASPNGKIYKSINGGLSWAVVYEKQYKEEAPDILTVQYGKANGEYFGAIALPLAFPSKLKSEDCVGFGVTLKANKLVPNQAFLIVKLANGASYRSRNLNECFKNDQWQDITLKPEDFSIDSDYAKANAAKAKELPPTPDLSTITRVDFPCSGNLPGEAYLIKIRKFYFAVTNAPDGQTATADTPILWKVRDFSKDKSVQKFGNTHLGGPVPGPAYSVAVSAKNPLVVGVANRDNGILLSENGGETWTELNTPKSGLSLAFDPTSSAIIYGAFADHGLWKSMDQGKTWGDITESFGKGYTFKDVAVSQSRPLDICVIASHATNHWQGVVGVSHDGGKTWKKSTYVTVDQSANPTMENVVSGSSGLSAPSNIALNPLNPNEIFLSANWRPCFSDDGGLTWTERDRGTDISCIHDVRFSGTRTYVAVMDEGTCYSDDGGMNWRQLWPLQRQPEGNGHCWRLGITNTNGVDRIIGTFSPWNQGVPPAVIVSEDNGKSFKVTRTGLPNYTVRPNTMWGAGYPRALAVDPNDPKIVYLGIDGDPSDGKMGGGIFKSEDGGLTWKQLPNQPASRRMFYGLAVDPTNSKRLYWAACGNGGGLYRSEDGGDSWTRVFANETWVFNVVVAKDGTVYCPGNNLWRSTDHGSSWHKISSFAKSATHSIVGFDIDPKDSNTFWLSLVTWDETANGSVYKTTDGGETWQDITGNLAYNKPLILRFNPTTRELWAGGVTLHKIKQ